MEPFKIEPISVERLLQVFAFILVLFLAALFPLISLIYFTKLLFTKYYFITLLYLAWYVYDRKTSSQGGRRSQFLRKLRIWKYFRDYFPVTMVKTAELDPNKNYILGYHPHGFFITGVISCFATETTDFSKVYPGITPHPLTLEMQFHIPIHRELTMSSGACSVSKESIEWLLTKEGKGKAIVIVIGGMSEIIKAKSGKAILNLKRRKGFVRLAIKHGASLVPVFAFGENDIYDQFANSPGSLWSTIQEKTLKFIGCPMTLCNGRGLFQTKFGFLPHRKPVHVIIGKPIDVQKNQEPTEEDVNKLHQLYIEKLTELVEEYKPIYAPNLELNIC